MIVSIIKSITKSENNDASLLKTVRVYSSIVKAEEISDIVNADILDHKMAEHLENSFKKSLNEIHTLRRYYIAECYKHLLESLTKKFIAEYAVKAITHKDFRDDKLTTVTQAKKHRICLELLKMYTSVKDIDNKNNYKVDKVKVCLNLPESIKYLLNLVPKMAQVFDNTDASHSAKKSGLKSDKAKLGLLNSALYVTYEIKLKTSNKKNNYYYLVRPLNSAHAPKLLLYQTDEGQFYENGEDI
ncbi:11716_t:CDS:2 [Cetraspora pellucida]|uniref:11716_t:CDS:1 n=1 Tax=Cetraspora pellucida TaxID=1433469 RepID=A0ACA9KJB0_9GLOM|nr:11716_t:CDS:2 [Cetraspora pellucida]